MDSLRIETIKNYYDVLGLEPDCSKWQVKTAHLYFSILLDNQETFTGPPFEKLRQNIDEAYQTLMDDQLRKWHDQKNLEVQKIINQLHSNQRKLQAEILRKDKVIVQNQENMATAKAVISQKEAYIKELTGDSNWVILIPHILVQLGIFVIGAVIFFWIISLFG